jgi:hypothetical protein
MGHASGPNGPCGLCTLAPRILCRIANGGVYHDAFVGMGAIMTAFLRRTILGGSLITLVVGAIVFLLWHAVSVIRTGLEQVAAVLPFDTRFPALSALAALVLLAITLGLLLQVRPVHNLVRAGIAWLADRSPFSGLVHGFELELVGLGKSPIKPARVVLGDHECLAFVMEELADGRCVVFVPGSPKPSNGSVHIYPRECVRLIDASHVQVADCVSHWGIGTKKMLERERASA